MQNIKQTFIPSFVAFLVALLWIILPSAILFESCIIYTHPVMCMLLFSVWALQRKRLLLFSALVCCIVLTRSLFHPVLWLVPALWLGWRGNAINYILFNVAYVFVFGNALDFGENQRFMFLIYPQVLVLLVIGVYFVKNKVYSVLLATSYGDSVVR